MSEPVDIDAQKAEQGAREQASQDWKRPFKEAAMAIVQPVIDGLNEGRMVEGKKVLGNPEIRVFEFMKPNDRKTPFAPNRCLVRVEFNSARDNALSCIIVEFRDGVAINIRAGQRSDRPLLGPPLADGTFDVFETLASADLSPHGEVPKAFCKQLASNLLP